MWTMVKFEYRKLWNRVSLAQQVPHALPAARVANL